MLPFIKTWPDPSSRQLIFECVFVMRLSQASLLSSNANLTLKNNRCLLNCAHTSCCQWTRESDALECVLNR